MDPSEFEDGKREQQKRANELADRVRDLRLWALSRIGQCQIDEQKFGSGNISIEAARERMTLQAVLRILDGKETPLPSKSSRGGG